MSTHTERRSFNSEDAEEPHHDSQVMLSRCVALARPGSNGNTNAEMRGEKMESERGTLWLYRVKHHLNRITRLTPLIEEDDCPLKGYFGGGESALGSSLACS